MHSALRYTRVLYCASATMFGKFLFVLLVAVSLSQAASYHGSNEHRELDGIKETIDELIAKIKEAIAKIGDIIANLKDKISEIIGGIDIPKIIADIEAQIKEILDQAGADIPSAMHCITAEKDAVANLVAETTEQVQACMDTATKESAALIKEVIPLLAEAQGMIDDIKARAAKCVEDNKLNPAGLVKCLEQQVKEVTAKIEDMIAQIEDVAEKAQTLLDDVTACTTKIQADVTAKKNAIIADFKKCVEELNP